MSLVAAEAPQRIRGEINEGERVALSGNVKPSLVSAKDQGAVSGSLVLPTLTLHFAMSASQKADLLQLLQQQQTRHSTQFHKWLTPEQYADRFGMNEKDLQKVTAWLQTQGFTNVQSARGRTFVTFSGTAAQAQQAFHTSIHNYLMSDGATHYANATEPQFPKALNGVVESIRGLHNFRAKPHLRSRPHLTSSVTGNHFLVPDDWATIYDVKALYNSGFNGTGSSIVVVGQTDLVMADIEAFQAAVGLTVKDPQVIQVPTGLDPGVQAFSGDLGESDLDLEWANGIAPGAELIFVKSQDVEDAETFAVDNNVADVLSITYGLCEQDYGAATENSLNSLFQQAAAEGMTVVAASGDQGAADCDDPTSAVASNGLAVDVPAALPYVTGVGGTEFNEGTATGGTQYWNSGNNANSGSAISYIPEIAWNDSVADAALSSSGGGASVVFAKPSWQTGTGVPSDGFRDVPDLALTASADHDGYLTCSETQATATAALVPTCVIGLRAANPSGGCAALGYTAPCGDYNVSGGTSAAAPSFAGIVAILNQQTGARQGWINPNLYSLASISSNAFHDITSGTNIVPCKGATANCSSSVATLNGTFGYTAGTGYDQVTGWGSIDAYNFVQQWNDDFLITSSPTSLSVSPGTSGTATINITPHGSFTGNVTFSCSVATALTATTCSIPGTVSGGTGSVTLTVTAGASARTPWWHLGWYRIPKFPNVGLLLLLLLAAGACLLIRPQKRKFAGFACTMLLMAVLSGCGGGGSSTSTGSTGVGTTTTPSVTGNVTVTATSGSLVNSTTISVTVP